MERGSPKPAKVPCWQWLMTQYLISWDLITYYAECGANKLESPVSWLIDDTADPAFVCSNVPMLVTTTKARWNNAACHRDGGLLALLSIFPMESFICLVLMCVHEHVWRVSEHKFVQKKNCIYIKSFGLASLTFLLWFLELTDNSNDHIKSICVWEKEIYF